MIPESEEFEKVQNLRDKLFIDFFTIALILMRVDLSYDYVKQSD